MAKKNRKRRHIGLKILVGIIILVAIAAGALGVSNLVVKAQLVKYAKSFDKVNYTSQLVPVKDEDGYYCFTTDENFKVMQLTDLHIGSGVMSKDEDQKALNAIAAMVTYEKPDLVIVSGDISFPVPYIAGTFNNKATVEVFATLMERLDVYWTVTFGNHDSEAYNYYKRDKVASFYSNPDYDYCLFQAGPADVYGYGNQIIKVMKSNGLINKAIFIIDSNMYMADDPLGLKWHYDNVHTDQIEWYSKEIDKMSAYNKEKLGLIGSLLPGAENYTTVQSFIFQHIPVNEFKTAYEDYVDNGYADTADTKYLYGVMGEDPNGLFSYGPMNPDNFFETILEKGSTKAMFCGHDHLNNFAFKYKGVVLAYGMSIDYLAYDGIDNYGSQRGCTIITIKPNTSWTSKLENYYQDKYVSKYQKETVSFDPYYPAA